MEASLGMRRLRLGNDFSNISEVGLAVFKDNGSTETQSFKSVLTKDCGLWRKFVWTLEA